MNPAASASATPNQTMEENGQDKKQNNQEKLPSLTSLFGPMFLARLPSSEDSRRHSLPLSQPPHSTNTLHVPEIAQSTSFYSMNRTATHVSSRPDVGSSSSSSDRKSGHFPDFMTFRNSAPRESLPTSPVSEPSTFTPILPKRKSLDLPAPESGSRSSANSTHRESESISDATSPLSEAVNFLMIRSTVSPARPNPAHNLVPGSSFTLDNLTISSPSDAYRFQLTIEQQPELTKVSGLSDRDRRTIDPPPILCLTMEGGEEPKSPATASADLRYQSTQIPPFMVVQASLWHEVDDVSMDLYRTASGVTHRALLGTVVTTPYPLARPDGQRGYYFIFPELYVTIPGTFRLRFALYDIRGPLSGDPGSSSETVKPPGVLRAVCFSTPFGSFYTRDYPGTKESTELTRWIAGQGVKIPVRTESRVSQLAFDSRSSNH